MPGAPRGDYTDFAPPGGSVFLGYNAQPSLPPRFEVASVDAVGTTCHASASTGNDDWPSTESQPWQTLAKVSSMTFQPGDQILLKRGDVWDGEELILRGSGNFMDDTWITLGAYGDGDKPRLTNPPDDPTPGLVDWTAVAVYIDFPRNISGAPVSAARMFILPRGKVLKSVTVSCPAGATVAFYQRQSVILDCASKLTHYDTGWASPALSNIVSIWMDLSAVADKNVNDVWIDDIVYGD